MAEEEEEELENWSDLPYHLVELIMEKMMIPELSDYIRCGGVCSSWRTAFLDHPHPLPPRRLQQPPPFLIVPTPISYSTTETNTMSISFYNIIHQKVYNQFQINIPNHWYICGSSHGWLVLADYNYQVRLFNPFLTPSPSSEIILPPLHNDPCDCSYLLKVVLSADPSSNPTDYIVLAILGPLLRLSYYRPISGGDERWTPVEIDDSVHYSSHYEDVIYSTAADRFLALHRLQGEVFVLDPEQDMKVTMCIREPLEWTQIKADMKADKKFLVESSGDLLQIHRYVEINLDTCYATYTFRVFKVVVNDDEEQEWIHLKHLGDRTLFVGNNDTISVCASNYPGCKPNCIYFIKQQRYSNHELGVFNLEDESIEDHYPTDKYSTQWMREWMIIWIEPSVQKNKIKCGDQNILTELMMMQIETKD